MTRIVLGRSAHLVEVLLLVKTRIPGSLDACRPMLSKPPHRSLLLFHTISKEIIFGRNRRIHTSHCRSPHPSFPQHSHIRTIVRLAVGVGRVAVGELEQDIHFDYILVEIRRVVFIPEADRVREEQMRHLHRRVLYDVVVKARGR